MENKRKMNGLYKTGFILLMVCLGLFIGAIIAAYAFVKVKIAVVLGAGGAFLAFLGIIFVMLSKPKKIKNINSVNDDAEEKKIDNINIV